MIRKLFVALSLSFAFLLLLFVVLSRPTDYGPGILPFAIPFSICSAGFAIASAFYSKD